MKATQFAKLCAEVVETERTYINGLSTMMKVYYTPLVHEAACACFTAEHERILFGNFPQILELNKEFLDALEKSSVDALGTNFLKFIPFMKMYSVYCAGFDGATELLEKLLVEDKFLDFQLFAQKCLAKTDGTTLSSYLILPIQRIPRYKMLLHELVKSSDKNSLSNLQQALEEVKTVASMINEQIRARQNQTEIYALTQLFVGDDPQFLKPGRALLRRTDLVKQCRGGPKTFHFILFSDCLVYASSLLGKYKLHRKIPIDQSFRVLAHPEKGPNVAEIQSSQKSFVVEFPNPTDMKDWLEDILDCMRDFHKENKIAGTMHTQVKEPAALLKNKNSSQSCGLCQSEFSVFNRAVHCRLCGNLFCRDCTKTKVPLTRVKRGLAQEGEANESLKLKRICSQCAKARQAEKSEKRKRLVAQIAKSNAVVYEAFEAIGVSSLEQQVSTGSIEPMCPVRSSSFVTKKRGAETPTIFDRVDLAHRRLDDLQKQGGMGSKIKKALKFEGKPSKQVPKQSPSPDLAELQTELEDVVARESISQQEEQPHLVFQPRLSDRLSSDESKCRSPSPSPSPEQARSPEVRFHVDGGTPTTGGLSFTLNSASSTATTPRLRQSFTLRPPSRPPPAAPKTNSSCTKNPDDNSLQDAVPLTSSLASSAMLASLSGSLVPSAAGFTFSKPPPLTSSFSSPSLFSPKTAAGLTVTRRSPRRSPLAKSTSPQVSYSTLSTVHSSMSNSSLSPPSPSFSRTLRPSDHIAPPSAVETSPSDDQGSFSEQALAALPTLPRYYLSQHATLIDEPVTPPASDIVWELYDFDDEDSEIRPQATVANPLSPSVSVTPIRSPSTLRSPTKPGQGVNIHRSPKKNNQTPQQNGTNGTTPRTPPLSPFTSTITSSPNVFSKKPHTLPSPMTFTKTDPAPGFLVPPTPPSLEPPSFIPDSPMKAIPAYLLTRTSKPSL